MGCDIHCVAEIKRAQGYVRTVDLGFGGGLGEPFGAGPYAVFSFLADVRNDADIRPIAMPRGWPGDASKEAQAYYKEWTADAHSASWLLVEELSSFDYDQIAQTGASGMPTAYREFLGPDFFDDLHRLQEGRASRIVFFFDN